MANRIEISEKLRSQIRELEKEKRDIQRRYNEQVCNIRSLTTCTPADPVFDIRVDSHLRR